MQIIIKSRNVVLPRRLREFATTKFAHLEKLLDRIQSIEIAVGESAARKVVDKSVVEVTLTTGQRRLHAEAHGPDIMTAVEAAVAKVESQVRRLKGKAISRTRRGGGHVMADRIAATAALNGAADAPTRIATKAKAGIRPVKTRKPAPKKAAPPAAAARRASAKKKAAAAAGSTKRTAAASKPKASTRKATSTSGRSAARKTSAKRAGAGSKGRG